MTPSGIVLLLGRAAITEVANQDDDDIMVCPKAFLRKAFGYGDTSLLETSTLFSLL